MKRRAETLEVEAPGGVPQAVFWHGRRCEIAVLDAWRAASRWWLGGETRRYFLIALPGGAVLEIYEFNGIWTLCRVAD